MPNITKKHLIIIVFVIIIIIVVVASIFLKKNKTESKPKEDITAEDIKRINIALKRSNITIINEHFQNDSTSSDIVFDSFDKIIKNFDLFMNTYYPSMNLDDMNEKLKNYGVTKTLQELIQIPIFNDRRYQGLIGQFFETSILIMYLSMSDYLNGGPKGDIICSFIGLKIMLDLSSQLSNRVNQKIVYLNDFEKTNEFTLYYVPSNYDISDISKLSNNTDIPEYYFMDNRVFSLISGYDLIKPYKMGCISYVRNAVKQQIISIKTKQNTQTSTQTGSSNITVSEDEINQVFKILKDNLTPFSKFLRLTFIAPFIIIYTQTALTESSQIIKDLIELVTPSNNHFTSDFIKLFGSDSFFNPDFIAKNNFDQFRILV